MAYSTKNCMVGADEVKKIREREIVRGLQLEMIKRTFEKYSWEVKRNNE